MRIRELDRDDAADVRAYFDTEQSAIKADRPHALIREWKAFAYTVAHPGDYYRYDYLVAEVDGQIAGVATVELPVHDNLHVAGIEVDVLPARRRRGVGRALWEECVRRAAAERRTSILGEVNVAVDAPTAALEFARAMGCAPVHSEHHLLLDLPVREPGEVAFGYELVLRRDRCPDEHREAFLAMRNRMNTDVPMGELDWDAVVLDEQRLADSEARTAEAYDVFVAAARRLRDGVFGGYSTAMVPHGQDYAWQDDTLVMPEHRGSRLGAALKTANYARLPREVRAVHTWTAPDNAAMYRTNTRLGFRVVEHLHEVQRSLA